MPQVQYDNYCIMFFRKKYIFCKDLESQRGHKIFSLNCLKKMSTVKINFGGPWELEFSASIFFITDVGIKTNTCACTGKQTKKNTSLIFIPYSVHSCLRLSFHFIQCCYSTISSCFIIYSCFFLNFIVIEYIIQFTYILFQLILLH